MAFKYYMIKIVELIQSFAPHGNLKRCHSLGEIFFFFVNSQCSTFLNQNCFTLKIMLVYSNPLFKHKFCWFYTWNKAKPMQSTNWFIASSVVYDFMEHECIYS